MSIARRSAVTAREGGLATGAGSITGASRAAAAAHSACDAMAHALCLGQALVMAQRLRVEASVNLHYVDGLPITISSHLVVPAQIRGLGADRFQKAVDEAAVLCPICRPFARARISVEALLEPS